MAPATGKDEPYHGILIPVDPATLSPIHCRPTRPTRDTGGAAPCCASACWRPASGWSAAT